ncbi:MAG: hypothetical protein ABFS46_02095 [Myxococcota bacterium]
MLGWVPLRPIRVPSAVLALVLLLGLVAGPAAASDELPTAQDGAPAVNLEGTWHVLVHYKDSQVGNPDMERWEDRVWVFRKEHNRMIWIDYPIVAFDNKSGRFGAVSGNPRARILHYWEPNAVQLQELSRGPKVNSRGSREKRLRPSEDGWRSYGEASAAGAMTITFTTHWFVDDASGHPVFRMEDSMGSATLDSIEGGTRYATESIEKDGDVLRGRFDRDGTRTGTFRLLRTAPVRGLGSKEEQQERIRNREAERFRRQVQEAAGATAEEAPAGASGQR